MHPESKQPTGEGAGQAVPEDGPRPTRRQWVRMVAQGAAAPAVALWGARVAAAPDNAAAAGGSAGGVPSSLHVVRDFHDPYLELLRLLHVAAEIEHGLMIQYLYGAFSVKPIYQALAGYGAPHTKDLMGIAVQEMQHLGKVNQLLVALGAAPTLIREDLPYEPDINPFRLRLEPLSRLSLAKYVWCESPPGATDGRKAQGPADAAFCRELESTLGAAQRPNFVGDLYDTVIQLVKELNTSRDRSLPDLQPWLPVLQEIKDEGEVGHYPCFRRAFLGTHEGFAGQADVWRRPMSDPLYPAYPLPIDPTAYVGHENQIMDPTAQQLAWLGNLHYWSVLSLLSLGYSTGTQDVIALSRGHMMGPFFALARKLAQMGSGMPFDPLGQGYQHGLRNGGSVRFVRSLLLEADRLEKHLAKALPGDFPADMCRGTLAAVAKLEPALRSARAPGTPWDDGLA